MNKTKGNRVLIWLVVAGVIIISAAATFFSALLTDKSSTVYKVYYENLKPGYIAEENVYVKSSLDIIDQEETLKAKQSAKEAVLPVFTFDSFETMKVLSAVDEIRKTGKYPNTVISTVYNLVNEICAKGLFDETEINKMSSLGYQRVLVINQILENSKQNEEVLISDILTFKKLSDYVENKLADTVYTQNEKNQILALVLDVCKPNIPYDSFRTEETRQEVYNTTAPVIISLEKGDLLIEKDKVIQQSQLDLIKKIENSRTLTFSDVVNHFASSLIIFGILLVFFYKTVKDDAYHSVQYTGIFIFFTLFVFAVSYFELFYASFIKVGFIFAFMPITLLPVLMTSVTDNRKIGLISSFVVAGFSSILPGVNLNILFYCAIIGFAAVILTKFIHRRLDTLFHVVLLAAVSLVISFISMYVGAYSFKFIEIVSLGILANVAGAQILNSIFLPVLEKVFNLPTVLRMYELAYSESSLLKRLYQAAPGTSTHSRQVAELAQSAADVIGANALIARVGALYHDIGKTDYPEYFVENQTSGNKHDDINPSLSASIIKSHVKVGYDKGKEAKLPPEVLHIIVSHHGNDLISFFYHEALKEEDKELGKVKSEDYSYNADIPATKECAIVMLADSIEAASRTIQEPTPAKFTKLINQIVVRKLERGQMNNCNLSMNEIEKIKQSFLNTLTATYHSRIQYPDEEEKE